jgi:ABC-2 type transport system ATP-binding protein
MLQYAIHTQNLTYDFPEVRAVDSLTLDVPRGIIFGLLGPEGSGKTTTIQLLLGLLKPTGGSAQVLGYDVATDAAKLRAITGLLMEHGLFLDRSAEDNLELYARIFHVPAGERQERIKHLLTHLNLWQQRGEQVRCWSKGMCQKLAIARVLLHRPPLIFLDEPTAGLDPVASAELREDLATLAAERETTVFLNARTLVEVEGLCEQVGVMHAGKLLTVCRPDALREQARPRLAITGRNFNEGILSALRAYPDVRSVKRISGKDGQRLEVELDGAVESAPFVAAIVSAGGQIDEVKRIQSSLEDVLLTLTQDEQEED